MDLTRIDTKKLTAAVALASKKIAEAHEALAPFLILLTDNERSTTLRAPAGFPKAGRSLADSAAKHPELVAAADEYDPAAVVEDLDNVEAIEQLAGKLAELQTLLADSRLTWLAEAYVPSLELYGMAKIRAKKDAALAQSIAPLAEVFATRRRKKG